MTHAARLTAILTLAAAACGGGGDAKVDATITVIDAALPASDAATCDPTTVLPPGWQLIGLVSTGAVTVTTTGGVTRGTIDATAGGTANAGVSPYLYLDLVNGTKVDLTDPAARSSTAWHVAFKRAGIMLNGGDSGPGQVAAAAVPAATLAEVTTVPAALAVDDWADPSCQLVAGPTGEPATVMSSWYDYNPTTHQLTPTSEVWVIRVAPGVHRKLRITTYYGDPTQPMRGAFYGVEWAPL
jgi:hypothetical protein